ncbi:MAG: tetratricopeptide repeat protein [Hyphomicrobiales bacterium]
MIAVVPALALMLSGGPMSDSSTTLADFDAKWNYDDPAGTEKEFRALLPAARASGNHDYLAQLLTQIARTEGLQRRFDDAERTLADAESLITPEMGVARVRLLLERGRMLNSSKRRDESKPLFLDAWNLAREVHADGFAVDAAHMLGIVEPGDSSVTWNERAMALAESSSDPKARTWLGSLYNNLGWTYHDMGRYDTALDLFHKALAEREKAGKKEDIRVARWCIARCLRSLGKVDEALKMQRALYDEFQAEGGMDGYVVEEIGECLLLKHEDAEAKPFFARAYEELSKDPWLRDSEAARLERLGRLGGVLK